MPDHHEVRRHPETGEAAVQLPDRINGAGQRWLLVGHDGAHVTGKAMDEDDVADWPQLTPASDGDSE